MFDITKYINRLPLQLLKYSGNVCQFRCPFCGDSRSKPFKRSAYIINILRDSPYFYCHRCRHEIKHGNSFQNFLKEMDYSLWSEYISESKNYNLNTFFKNKENKEINIITIQRHDRRNTLYEKYLKPVSLLNEDNIIVKYLMERQIHRDHWDELFFFIGNPYSVFNKVFKTNKYVEKERTCKTSYKGVLVPFYDKNGRSVGFSIRFIGNTGKIRFLNLYYADTNTKFIFGEDKADFDKPIIVLEGLFDKLSFDDDTQILSMVSSNTKIDYVKSLAKNRIIYVFDNEYNNPNLVKSMEDIIDSGLELFIWNNELNGVKDINDVKKKYHWNDNTLWKYILRNTYKGLNAKIALQKRINEYHTNLQIGIR